MEIRQKLEEVKSRWGATMNPKDIVWLIRQVERIPFLEKENQSLKRKIQELEAQRRD